MAKNKSMTLGDHFDKFVEDQVQNGRFSNASEVVRAGLRLLENEETKLRALRAALLEGEESGPAAALDWDAFMDKLHAGKERS